ncbi:MAG: ABC transporter ATP-binding protein [Paenibacillus sp. RIFOXYA1_FULL_44_5]|nr:MAG: ABC transporter ATP-binding protein [Paenibacillus sp. RIFOXYA1_FULL_44_5]
MNDAVVLSVHDLHKQIGNKLIIKGISFDVREGEIFGFLGPNGSGKTTTIRMLVDLIRPTKGTVTICGHDVHKEHNKALQYVGAIVENPELYPFLTGWENLEQFAVMLPNVSAARIQEVIELVGLDQRIHDRVKTYSLGMRQRLGIAQALLGNPKLLILDEPTNGLDPQGIKEMRHFIRSLAQSGLSLFVSSHLLGEVQQLCDRVAIISHGKVLTVGTVNELVNYFGNQVIWDLQPADSARELLRAIDDITIIDNEWSAEEFLQDPRIYTEMDAERIPAVTEMLVQQQIAVKSIEIKRPTLEDLFLHLTEGERIE